MYKIINYLVILFFFFTMLISIKKKKILFDDFEHINLDILRNRRGLSKQCKKYEKNVKHLHNKCGWLRKCIQNLNQLVDYLKNEYKICFSILKVNIY